MLTDDEHEGFFFFVSPSNPIYYFFIFCGRREICGRSRNLGSDTKLIRDENGEEQRGKNLGFRGRVEDKDKFELQQLGDLSHSAHHHAKLKL